MTQYLMKPDIDAKDLQYALKEYFCERIVVSAFSLGKRRGMNAICRDLDSSLELKISSNKDWKFYIDNKELIKITPDKDQLFKLEYQDHRQFRIYPYFEDPNDPRMILPTHSVFKNVIDDYLLEIFFKGKIPLIEDKKIRNVQYYKIKR